MCLEDAIVFAIGEIPEPDLAICVSIGRRMMLGDGVYVTRNIQKTLHYGEVCFKLLVYPGKTFIVDDTTPEEERTKWHTEYGSAWLVPNNSIHHTKQEETCVKSSSQVRILG